MQLTKTLWVLPLLLLSLVAGAQEAVIRKNLAERIPHFKNSEWHTIVLCLMIGGALTRYISPL